MSLLALAVFGKLKETHLCSRHIQVAAALARIVEAEQGIFTAIMVEARKPGEGVVVLLDTYSMQSTGFAADGDEQEGEEDDGSDGDDDDESDNDGEDSSSDSDSEEEDEEEGSQERVDLGADVKFGLPALPHPVEIVCPHELQCPLTQGIFLDPVIASNGQVRLSVLLFGSLRTHPA